MTNFAVVLVAVGWWCLVVGCLVVVDCFGDCD